MWHCDTHLLQWDQYFNKQIVWSFLKAFFLFWREATLFHSSLLSEYLWINTLIFWRENLKSNQRVSYYINKVFFFFLIFEALLSFFCDLFYCFWVAAIIRRPCIVLHTLRNCLKFGIPQQIKRIIYIWQELGGVILMRICTILYCHTLCAMIKWK